jgi:predicted helicase
MLSGIPPECYQYRLGNRSTLEWVIDQWETEASIGKSQPVLNQITTLAAFIKCLQ